MNDSIKRVYDNDAHDAEPTNDITYFVGTEVERTAQYGQRTLFVVGIQSADEVVRYANEYKAGHIYLGANKSFNIDLDWEPLVDSLLQAGLWVTLDFPIRSHNAVMRILGNHMRKSKFIPMISVEIPNVEVYNYNTVLKIDDIDMDHSNPGVWCHSLHELLDRDVFTAWDEYQGDELIK